MIEQIDIVFDGPPSAVAGRFVECERADGSGVRVGQWIKRSDGYWVLRLLAASSPVSSSVRNGITDAVLNELADHLKGDKQ